MRNSNMNIEWKKGEGIEKKENIEEWLKSEVNITGYLSKEIKEIIEKEIFKNDDFFTELDNFGSIIFSGETGTGKTFLAEKLASSFSSFYTILSSSDFVSKFAGEQVENVVKLENEILEKNNEKKENRNNSPLIVVINEIDSLLLKKNTIEESSLSRENAKITNAFQTFCDKLKKEEINVRIIGTTNNLNFIEKASLRRLGSSKIIGRMAINSDFISNFLINFMIKVKKIGWIEIEMEDKKYDRLSIMATNEIKKDISASLTKCFEKKVEEKKDYDFIYKLYNNGLEIKFHLLEEIVKSSILNYVKKYVNDNDDNKNKINNVKNTAVTIKIEKLMDILFQEIYNNKSKIITLKIYN